MRVLVTGAAGFIGSHLVDHLLSRGDRVLGIDNFDTGSPDVVAPFREHERFEFVKGDISDIRTVRQTVADVGKIYHQAAIPSVPRSFDDPVAITEANCLGTTNILAAARDANVEKIVVASSAAVYGKNRDLPLDESMSVAPESPYALSKHWTEKLAVQASEHYEIDAVALRYFNVFGPGQDPTGDYASVVPAFIANMVSGRRPVIYGDGEQTRDFIYVEDVVEANLKAMNADVSGQIFNVASGTSTSINYLVEVLNDVLDRSIEPRYEAVRSGDIRHSRADLTKAKRELGFSPKVELDEGLDRIISQHCEHPRSPTD